MTEEETNSITKSTTSGSRQILLRPVIILSVLFIFKGYLTEEAVRGHASLAFTIPLLAQLLIIPIGSFLALRGNRIAQFLMIGLLWYTVLGSVFAVLFAPLKQHIIKILALVLGCYFSYGAIQLWKGTRRITPQGTPNQAL